MGETKKKVRPGNISASSTELALLIDFQQEEHELLEDGSVGKCLEKSAGSKKIKVGDALTANADLDKIAAQLQLQCKLIKPSAIGAVKAALQQLVEREAGKGKGPTPAANNVKSDSGATETVRPSSRHGLRAAGRLQVEEGRSSRGDWGDGAEGLERRSKDLEAAGSCADEANKGKGAAEASSAQRSTDATKCGEGAETAGRQGEEGCRTRGHTSSKGRKHKNSDKKSRRDQMSSESKVAKQVALGAEQKLRQEQQDAFQRHLFEASLGRKYANAVLEDLDTYMEQLYEEDLGTKVHALGMIAQLFRRAASLKVLLAKTGLVQLLARTLRESGKKSMDLATNVVSVFFSLSYFSCFHGVIMDNQVGAMTLDLIGLEIQRTALRVCETGISPADIAQKVVDATSGAVVLSNAEKKMITIIQKQDRMLYLCFFMLLNLAERDTVERKMTRKNIVSYLVEMLSRSNVEVLILAVTFLKKLSIYKENKDQMIKSDIIVKLNKYVPVRNQVLTVAILRLLHNLSFDHSLRADMVAAGMVPKLVDLMQEPRLAPICMGILYHISVDDKHKSLFTFTEAIKIIYGRLMSVCDLRREPELIALAVNLTQNQRCALALCEGPNFDKLMKKAIDTKDDLLFKVIRNCSQVDDLEFKRRFSPYVESGVMLLKAEGVTADLFVEVLGTLANLCVPEFDFQALVRRHDLLNFLAKFAEPDAVDDDILLEVIMFIGNAGTIIKADTMPAGVLCNAGTAEQIEKAGLVELLFQHMGDKKDDDEFVLQITFTFCKLLTFRATSKQLLENTKVVFYLVDLLQDPNKEIRKYADKALEVLMETVPTKAPMVRELKFKTFNQEWLEEVEHHDDTIPAFQSASAESPNLAGLLDFDDDLVPEGPDATVEGRVTGLDGLLGSPGNVDLPEVTEDDSSDCGALPEYV